MMSKESLISIVVPVMNEEESLQLFYKALVPVLEKMPYDHEIIFVDDGSTDSSLSLLKTLAKEDTTIRVFSFRRNLGKAEALSYGFMKAKGEYIVTLDADLQDLPTEIPHLLEKLQNEEWDVVSGWRKDRKDKKKMVVASRFFNAVASRVFDIHLHDYNCGLKAYTKEAAKSLQLYGGMHRFIPLLAYDKGFSVTEMPVEHQERQFGTSKYHFSKLWKDLPDIFTMLFLAKYSKKPLHFFGLIGGIAILIGLIILIYLAFLHFSGVSIGRRPLLFFGMVFVLGGLQIFFTGFLADLMIHISHTPSLYDEKATHYALRYSTDRKPTA